MPGNGRYTAGWEFAYLRCSMYSVVYFSSATVEFSNQDLIELLKVCHRNNEAKQVTGMLLYKNGNFIQVLEGERAVVQSVYDQIGQDPRHKNLLRVLAQETDVRQFANWSMGFATTEALPESLQRNFSTLLELGTEESAALSDQRTWKLLLSFRDSIR